MVRELSCGISDCLDKFNTTSKYYLVFRICGKIDVQILKTTLS